jgi:hypothetical protein
MEEKNGLSSSPRARSSASLKIAQFLSIILIALVAGVLWGTWVSLARSMTSFSAELYLGIGKAMINNLAQVMAFLFVLAILATIVALLYTPDRKSAAFYLTLIGLLFLIAALIVTLLLEVPVDNQTRHWTLATLPANWLAIRARWESYHALRTLLSLISLGLVVAGALSPSASKV